MAILPDQDLGFNGNSTTTITVSGTFPAGALILVAVDFGTATASQSISQSGSTFTNIVTRENSATNNLVYWNGYITNWGGGALSTTFTLSGTGKDAAARLLSFMGVKPVSPLLFTPKDAGGAPNSTTFDSGAATGTALANCLVVGFFGYANSTTKTFSNPTGAPYTGWTLTATSNGSSGNTPHGHAHFMWTILSGTPVAAPRAICTASATASYSATVAAFQEDYNSYVDFATPLLQLASKAPPPGGKLTGSATGTYTYVGNVLSDGAVSAQYTTADTASAVTIVPGSATGQYTYTGNVLSNGEVSGQYIYNGVVSAVTIVPGSATGTYVYAGAVLSNGEVGGQSTSSGGSLGSGEAGGFYVYAGVATGVVSGGGAITGSATGQYTYNGAVQGNGMAAAFYVYAGTSAGVLSSPAAMTPVGTIAGPNEPSGSIAGGTVLGGTITAGSSPGGIIQAGTQPQGTIQTGIQPDGTIVRD